MKKLLTNLLLAVLLNGFISAAPCTCTSRIKVSNISTIVLSADYNMAAQQEADIEIHPLDILALKFN